MSLINRAVDTVLLFLDRSGGILALLTNRNLFIQKVHIGHKVNYRCLATKQWKGNQSAFIFCETEVFYKFIHILEIILDQTLAGRRMQQS